MIQLRPAKERGRAEYGWLSTRYSFSFASYYDPDHMGFRHLRVINEDHIAPGKGFGAHSHRDMEIITYIVQGALEHKDSMGNTSVIVPGEVQRMSAGTGVTHSEFNHSREEPVHLLQIWIEPAVTGIPPGYEQKKFTDRIRPGELCLTVSPDGVDGSIRIHQDARLYIARLEAMQTLAVRLSADRHAWLQMVSGDLEANGVALTAGDGAAFSEESEISLKGSPNTEFLLFDLS